MKGLLSAGGKQILGCSLFVHLTVIKWQLNCLLKCHWQAAT